MDSDINKIENEETQEYTIAEPEQSNNIVFYLDNNKEIIRIEADGSFYVKGEKITDDMKLYEAFVKFFKRAGYYV